MLKTGFCFRFHSLIYIVFIYIIYIYIINKIFPLWSLWANRCVRFAGCSEELVSEQVCELSERERLDEDENIHASWVVMGGRIQVLFMVNISTVMCWNTIIVD